MSLKPFTHATFFANSAWLALLAALLFAAGFGGCNRCTSQSGCDDDQYCPEGDGIRECEDRADLKEVCEEDLHCLKDLTCATVHGTKECREDWGLTGDNCGSNLDCQPEFGCVEKNDNSCMETQFEGETCHYNAECAGDLVCNWGYDPDVCRPLGEDGDICGYFNECVDGLFCDDTTSPNLCSHPAEFGEECTEWIPCVEGLECIHTGLFGSGATYCYYNKGEDGFPCVFESQCSDSNWCYGVDAEAGEWGECHPAGLEGYPCGGDGICQPGLSCYGPEPLECRPSKEAGEECQGDEECDVGLICSVSPEAGECAPPSGQGGPCAVHYDCAEGLYCDSGTEPWSCRPPIARYDPCSDDVPCANGLQCLTPPEQDPICLALALEGEACDDWLPCDEGLVCDMEAEDPMCVPEQ